MEEKIKIKEPYTATGSFIGGIGGVILVIFLGIAAPVNLIIIGGLTLWGALCGRMGACAEAKKILKYTEGHLEDVSSKTTDKKIQQEITIQANDLTPLGKIIFGHNIEITKTIEK